ncbi:MAG: hypothetical protein H8E13_04125 [Actinobacteria bacterium]|nr:hypothetical protein [Actinomycetota bacterium]
MKQKIRYYLWNELKDKKWNEYSDDAIIGALKRKYTRRFLDNMDLFKEVLSEIKKALISNKEFKERVKRIVI